MANLTGKTIGELISLSAITDDTLFAVEYSGITYNIPYSAISYNQPYKVYTALLTQSGTNDPNVTVLENTLGSDITWKRSPSSGIYYGENVNFADPSKVWFSFQGNFSNQGFGNIISVGAEIYDDGPGYALWFETKNNAGNAMDGWGVPICVEIRVYP